MIKMSKKGLGKLVLGAGIGASLALLFAPKKGSDLRNDIKKKINEFMKSVDDMTVSEIKDEFTTKGTPVLEGIADDLKEKTISVAQEVIDKLEEK